MKPAAYIPKWVFARIEKHNHCTATIAKNVSAKANDYQALYTREQVDEAIRNALKLERERV